MPWDHVEEQMGEAYTDRHPERSIQGWSPSSGTSGARLGDCRVFLSGHVGGPAAVDSRLRGYDAHGRSKELRPPAWYAAVDRSCAKLYDGSVRSGTHAFLQTTRVHFGADALEKLEEEARPYDRAFVITGRSLNEKTSLIRRVEALLGGRHAGTFAGIGQHTPGSAVERAAIEAETAEADLLVSVGGGSVIDGTKAVARGLGYPQQVAIPTTLSGAEWANRAGVTDERSGRKRGFADPKTVPRVVVLDPEATVFTPEKLWLSTGIRAMDHAVEGFLFGGDHPITDVTGLEGARRLMESLPLSRREPEDLETRLELQLAAWLSYFGPANTPMGLSHELGRRIGASYEVPHGITSCIILAPSLRAVKGRVQDDRWIMLSQALGGDPPERVSSLVEELGLPDRLREVGVPEEDLEDIAGEYGGGEALAILEAAY
jgi:alcohol dehydrogenase class IV